jgi:hypothetical protein
MANGNMFGYVRKLAVISFIEQVDRIKLINITAAGHSGDPRPIGPIPLTYTLVSSGSWGENKSKIYKYTKSNTTAKFELHF